MFTGIIETVGIVRENSGNKRGVSTLVIDSPKLARFLKIGGSLAVNGACLTVVKKAGKSISFHLVRETLKRTALGALAPGEAVNLERPLKTGGRLEGHFVLGHIDGTGKVLKIVRHKEALSLLVSLPKPLQKYFIKKGSAAVNGVSLTLGKVGRGSFWVHLIPHTLKETNLGHCGPGTRLNLEADLLVKLVGKLS